MTVKPTVLPFWRFAEEIIKLKLTVGQRVLAKVAFGDHEVADLEGEELELARVILGGAEKVPDSAKRFVCMLLGRGSGKTTLCAAYCVYVAVCQPFSVGPGDTPYCITIAPDLPTAKLSIAMAREMIRSNPALERLVVGDEKQLITLRRPDGKQVKIEAFAASRGGSTVRGRTILSFLLDESCFFTSGEGYAVSDKDIFNALTPRLVKGGKGMLVSTPWPVENLLGTMHEANWGKPMTALAVKAPTLLVRGNDPDVVANVEAERIRDPDNARREYDCELDGVGGEGWFDAASLAGSLQEGAYTMEKDGGTSCIFGPYNPLWPTAAAMDPGFVKDSSTLVVGQYDGRRYHAVAMVEMRPKPGSPLKPSAVVAKFADVAKRYGCRFIISDSYYRETVKEHLKEHGLSLVDAPEGMSGKLESFARCRSVLHEGLVVLPRSDLSNRLVAQAKLVSGKPAPGGGISIKVPRKAGMGHGDLVSAWVVATYHLAYGRVKSDKKVLEVNTPEYNQEVELRIRAYYDKQQSKSLREAEREMKARNKGKRADGVTFAKHNR